VIANEGLAWAFTAWFAALTVISGVGAIRARRSIDRASYLAHVVMLAAMALMPWPAFMAVPDAVWIGLFALMAAGYIAVALGRPGVPVGPGAGRRARRLIGWYHAAMMLGMAWMVVLMAQLHAAAPGVAAPTVEFLDGHHHGASAPAPGAGTIPPLWDLPLWVTGVTFAFAAMFVVAAVRFLAQLRAAPREARPGQALPPRTELLLGAAIAAGMAASYFVMS